MEASEACGRQGSAVGDRLVRWGAWRRKEARAEGVARAGEERSESRWVRRGAVACGRVRASRWSNKGWAVDGVERGFGKEIGRLVG
jgi:hypothetical protein